MKHLSSYMGRFRIRITFIFGLIFIPLFCTTGFAEGLILTPSSDCMTCDGTASYSGNLAGDVTYQWFDSDSVLIFSETNDLGVSTINNLCPQVFFIEAIGTTETESCIFNVPSALTEVGQSSMFYTCNDAAPTDMFLELDGNPIVGGAWTDPNGDPVTGIFTPGISIDGLYQYTVLEGGCNVSSGLFITTNNNADPGNTTTYLICDTYSPFFLTDFMGGTPDAGGQWYGPGNIPVDGWFYPDTMQSSQFLYTIDTVAGCAPVSSAMFVVVNYLPDVGLNSELLVCPGAVIFDMTEQLDGTPELTGQWFDDNNIGVSNMFDPTFWEEGIYTYQINGETPCPNQQSTLDISFTNVINAGEGASVELCDSDDLVDMFAELGGNPSPSGIWLDPLNNPSPEQFDPTLMIEGVYTYEVNGIGCIPASAELTIDVENQLIAGNDAELDICQNLESYNLSDLLSANAMSGGQWYNDNDELIDSSISLIDFDGPNYTYILEGVLCPNDEAEFIVNVDEPVFAGPDQVLVFCENEGLIELENYISDPGLLDYSWTDSEGNAVGANYNPGVQTSTDYYYNLESGNSCPDDLAILELSTEYISFINDTSSMEICTSSIIFDLDEALDLIDPDVGVWTTPQGLETSSTIDLDVADSGIYTFTSNSNTACPSSVFELNLQVIAQLEAGDDGNLNICSDSESLSLFSLLENQSTDDGVWIYDNEEMDGQFDPLFNSPGEYVYLIDALAPCLSSEATFDIEVVESINFDIGLDISECSGSDPIEIGEEGQISCTYLWTPATYLSDVNVPNPILEFNSSGDELEELEYHLYIDNGICSKIDTLNVQIYPLPIVDLGPNLEICEGSILVLNGGLGSQYNWSPNWLFDDTSLSSQEIIMSSVDLDIGLIIENEFACSTEDELLITSLETPNVAFDASPEEGCVPLEVQLFNLSENDMQVDYHWQFSNGTIDDSENPSYIFYEEGTHDISLIAQAENGCTNSITISNFIQQPCAQINKVKQ